MTSTEHINIYSAVIIYYSLYSLADKNGTKICDL